jgi:hypothetical protein
VTDPLIAAARFLTAQLSWLRHATDQHGQPVAADVFREIGDCAARMRGLVDGPREQRFLGPCGAILECNPIRCADDCPAGCGITEPVCEGDVYGVAGAQTGRCRTCKTVYQQADRQQWIDSVRRDWLYHASEIAEAYPEIKANTVSKWYSRGLLASHGEHKGGPLFKVSEVLDLAAADAARREEIRADRDRRRKTAEMGA